MAARNVIFFHAESWDGRMLGRLGHPAMADATPNIDRVAAAGMQFDNAYCSSPICCPSRASMWSGRHAHNCEAWNNHKGLEPDMWALLDELHSTHEVATFGKLDYRSGGHSLMNRIAAWTGASGVDRPIFDACPAQEFHVADSDDPRCREGDWRKVDGAIEFLRRRADGYSDRPFFLYVSTGLVHPAFRTNRFWLDRIPAERVDAPPPDGCDHPFVAFQRRTKAWRYGLDEDTVRRVRRIYMAMCAEADAMVGAVYDAMRELGLDESTHFVFGSDHGELALEHRQYYKMSMYEGSVRVPLVLAGPTIPAGGRSDKVVSNVDLCPTFCELTGLETPPGLDGEGLLPRAAGRAGAGRDEALASFTGVTSNTSAWMLRRGQWKYVAYVGQPAQLFDLDADPGELHDLAAERADVAAGMDARLREIVDYEQAHRDWQAYCRCAFRQFHRQAQRGLYVDGSYGLADNPARDYRRLMDNAFTGYDDADEAKVRAWLDQAGE